MHRNKQKSGTSQSQHVRVNCHGHGAVMGARDGMGSFRDPTASVANEVVGIFVLEPVLSIFI